MRKLMHVLIIVCYTIKRINIRYNVPCVAMIDSSLREGTIQGKKIYIYVITVFFSHIETAANVYVIKDNSTYEMACGKSTS